MLIQLDQLLQISASVIAAFIGDGGFVNVSVNGTMESKKDLSESVERAAGSQQPNTISKRIIRILGNKGYLYDPCT